MKSFLRGVLTIWMTLLFMILGISLSLKGILLDTADVIIKSNIVEVMEEL